MAQGSCWLEGRSCAVRRVYSKAKNNALHSGDPVCIPPQHSSQHRERGFCWQMIGFCWFPMFAAKGRKRRQARLSITRTSPAWSGTAASKTFQRGAEWTECVNSSNWNPLPHRWGAPTHANQREVQAALLSRIPSDTVQKETLIDLNSCTRGKFELATVVSGNLASPTAAAKLLLLAGHMGCIQCQGARPKHFHKSWVVVSLWNRILWMNLNGYSNNKCTTRQPPIALPKELDMLHPYTCHLL